MTLFNNCSLLIIVSNNRKRWFVYKSDSGPGSFLSKLWATVLLTAEQQVPWFFRLVEEKRKQQLICSLLPSCVPLWYCTFYFLFIFRPRPCCPRCSMGLLPINKDSEAGIFRGFFIIIIYILSPITEQTIPVSQIKKEFPQRSRSGLENDATWGHRRFTVAPLLSQRSSVWPQKNI